MHILPPEMDGFLVTPKLDVTVGQGFTSNNVESFLDEYLEA
jgi:hypothetical protein